MRISFAAGLLLCGLAPSGGIRAQAVDPNLLREAAAVRAEVARSRAVLRQYTWTEETEVLVKQKVKSKTSVNCRYDAGGELIVRTPVGTAEEKKRASAVSNRPMVRKKADMQDYIERAVTRIHYYVPPKPEQLDYLLKNGKAALGRSAEGHSEIRFRDYYENGDSLVFTYDSVSKRLLRASIASTLGSPKDPVTMEAVFETLPDGVNHLSSATLDAKERKVQVKARNLMYQKMAP